MSELRQPLDYERLSEFRALVAALERRGNNRLIIANGQGKARMVEAVATFLWARLWVELGLFAQSNCQPGKLSAADAAIFARTVEGLFGDDCDPIELLKEAGILVQSPESGTLDLFCPWFARHNKHLAGDYKSKEERGNVVSAISRQQKRLAVEAVALGSLFAEEEYLTRAGQPIPQAERNRCLVLIRNLDNCFGAPARGRWGYSPGMMADAYEAVAAHDGEALKTFYGWLALHRDRPNVPKTAEQILREFETFYGVSLQD